MTKKLTNLIGVAEAMRILDEQAKERKLSEAKHREAEARESPFYLSDCRIEELEDALRTLLRLETGTAGGGVTVSEWEDALATAHKVLDEEDGLQDVAKGGAS